MIALESWEELPASKFEVEEAVEEGITIHPRLGPNRVVGKNGKVTGLEIIEVESVFDQNRRFNPKFRPSTGKKSGTATRSFLRLVKPPIWARSAGRTMCVCRRVGWSDQSSHRTNLRARCVRGRRCRLWSALDHQRRA